MKETFQEKDFIRKENIWGGSETPLDKFTAYKRHTTSPYCPRSSQLAHPAEGFFNFPPPGSLTTSNRGRLDTSAYLLSNDLFNYGILRLSVSLCGAYRVGPEARLFTPRMLGVVKYPENLWVAPKEQEQRFCGHS